MDPQQQPPNYADVPPTDTVGTTPDAKLDINTEEAGTLVTVSMANETTDQLRQISERISVFLASLPDYLGDFFGEYKRPLITIGLILGGFITFKLTWAVLDAVNDLPLLAPTFELVGIGYSAWFIYRYLIRASSRQELNQEFQALKGQVLGNKAPNA